MKTKSFLLIGGRYWSVYCTIKENSSFLDKGSIKIREPYNEYIYPEYQRQIKNFRLVSGDDWSLVCKVNGNGNFRTKGGFQIKDRERDKIWRISKKGFL